MEAFLNTLHASGGNELTNEAQGEKLLITHLINRFEDLKILFRVSNTTYDNQG